MKNKITLLLVAFFTLLSNFSFGHESNKIDHSFYESGKINVVLTVICVIFIGLIFYLVKLDRKISKLEKEVK